VRNTGTFDKLINGAIAMIWLMLAYSTLIHHELWRDEFQAILIAQKSEGLADVFFNSRYEGHGALWYILLFYLSKIDSSIHAAQYLHLAISFVTVLVVVFRSPFNFFEKLLICFGYFVLYEYTVIVRNYSLAMLFIVLIVTSIHDKGNYRKWILPVSLFMLCQTSIYGIIVAIALSLYILSDDSKQDRRIVLMWMVMGAMLGLWKMMPPADTGFAAEWFFGFDLKKIVHAFEIIYEAMIPLPKFTLHFWGTNILDGSPGLTAVKVLLSLVILVASFFLIRDKKLVAVFIIGTLAIVVFTYVKYFGFIRHFGHIYLLFLACMWLDRVTTATTKNYTFQSVLLVHVVVAAVAIFYEMKVPFSAARQTADFLEHRSGEETIISCEPDYIGTPLSGYMNRRMFYPQAERMGTYLLFDKKRKKIISQERAISITDSLYRGREIIYVFNEELKASNKKLLFKSEESIEETERYYVYQ
jgi:hypothetical protein